MRAKIPTAQQIKDLGNLPECRHHATPESKVKPVEYVENRTDLEVTLDRISAAWEELYNAARRLSDKYGQKDGVQGGWVAQDKEAEYMREILPIIQRPQSKMEDAGNTIKNVYPRVYKRLEEHRLEMNGIMKDALFRHPDPIGNTPVALIWIMLRTDDIRTELLT